MELPVDSLVEITGEGRYFRETLGTWTESSTQLRALINIANHTDQSVFVNPITHMSTPRALILVKQGMKPQDAISQAEVELINALGIAYPDAQPAQGIHMNMLGDDTAPNQYIFAVNCILDHYRATKEQEDSTFNLQSTLDQIASDLSNDGQLNPSWIQELAQAETTLKPTICTENVNRLLSNNKQDSEAPNLHSVLDEDQDGIVNANDTDDDDGDGVLDFDDCAPLDHSRQHQLSSQLICFEDATSSQEIETNCLSQKDIHNCIWPDNTSGLQWVYAALMGDHYDDIPMQSCNVLALGGFSDWRQPNMLELQSLIRDCPTTSNGGACTIDTECLTAEQTCPIDMDVPDNICVICSLNEQCTTGCTPRPGCHPYLDPEFLVGLPNPSSSRACQPIHFLSTEAATLNASWSSYSTWWGVDFASGAFVTIQPYSAVAEDNNIACVRGTLSN